MTETPNFQFQVSNFTVPLCLSLGLGLSLILIREYPSHPR
jgi:hypothetical protein